MKGKLIVIEGSDASGKATQVRLLIDRLKGKGIRAKTMSFPVYKSFFGGLVADYLNGNFGSLKEVHPKLASLLYALDRSAQKEKINGWLKEGYYVILDRYVESNMGYQGAKDEIVDWIIKLEYGIFKLPKPDEVFYLYVPIEISQCLLEDRPDKEYIKDSRKDIHESDTQFLKKVQENYLRLAKKYHWKIVNCTDDNQIRSKEDIAGEIFPQII